MGWLLTARTEYQLLELSSLQLDLRSGQDFTHRTGSGADGSLPRTAVPLPSHMGDDPLIEKANKQVDELISRHQKETGITLTRKEMRGIVAGQIQPKLELELTVRLNARLSRLKLKRFLFGWAGTDFQSEEDRIWREHDEDLAALRRMTEVMRNRSD